MITDRSQSQLLACGNVTAARILRPFVLSTLLMLICGLPFWAFAAEEETSLAPDKVSLTTPRYEPDPEFAPPLGTYTYVVSWQGIPAAEAKLSVTKEGDKYQLVAAARSYKVVDLLYRLRYQAEGILDAATLRPQKLVVDHHENSRVRFYAIDFQPSGLISAVYRKNNGPEEKLEFNPHNFTLDPFAAAFLGRASTWALGTERYYDVFNGKSRYFITFKVLRKGKERLGKLEQDFVVLSPYVKNVTKPTAKKKLHEARIFVTNDAKRDVVEVQSEVFVGTVKIKLKKFVPLSAPDGTKERVLPKFIGGKAT